MNRCIITKMKCKEKKSYKDYEKRDIESQSRGRCY